MEIFADYIGNFILYIRKSGKISDVSGSGQGDGDDDDDELFCGIADRRKALSLISSQDYC